MARPQSAPVEAPPPKLGRYRIEEPLGEGGMGAVYAAVDDVLGRRVAIKVLRGTWSEEGRERLRREARALARLSHPNVVEVFEIGFDGGVPYIVMELVEGQTLRSWLKEGHPWPEALQVCLQAGTGLAAAHREGLRHRDFKPHNVMIAEGGAVKVLDFGIALVAGLEDDVAEPPGAESPERSWQTGESRLTEVGTVMGTPAYMAPEQLIDASVDHRADQFAFCLVCFEALYGRRPFSGRSPRAIRAAIRNGKIASVDAAVPAAIHRAVLRGLRFDPEQRWPSMDALLEALRPPSGRRFPWRVLLAAGVVGVGVASWDRPAPARPECDADARLAEVWSAPQRDAVRQALIGEGDAIGTDAWERVEPAFDEFAAQWSGALTSACAATAEDGLDGATMSCLDHRLTELDALVDEMSRPDPAVRRTAAGVAASLRAPECPATDEPATLRPEDPEVERRVDALRQRLVRAQARHDADRGAEALADVVAIEAEAQAIGYEPFLARVYQLHGVLLDDVGRSREAADLLTQSFELAVANDQPVIAAGSAAHRAVIEGSQLGRPAEARRWIHHAEAAAARLGNPPHIAYAIPNARAMTLLAEGHWTEAVPQVQEARRLAELALGPDDPRVADLYNNEAAVLTRDGKYDEAMEAVQRADEIYRAVLGEHHPRRVNALSNIGVLERRLEHYDEAVRCYEEAVELLRATHLDHQQTMGGLLQNIGIVYVESGQPAKALKWVDAAVDLWTEVQGPEHLDTAFARYNRAVALGRLGRHAEALAEYEAALEVRRLRLPDDSPLLLFTMAFEGATLHELGRDEEAIPMLREGIEGLDAVGLHGTDTAAARFALAQALAATDGDPAEIRTLLDTAAAEIRPENGYAETLAADVAAARSRSDK